MDVAGVSRFLGVLALVAGAVALVLVVPWLRSRPGPRAWVRRDGTWLAAAVAFVATTGSLYYSEVADLVPCTVAWVEVFGVLTIPTMAGLGFAAVVALTGRWATPAGEP